MTRHDRMVVRIGPNDLSQLSGLPASLRIAAMLLVRLRVRPGDVVLVKGSNAARMI